MTVRELPAGTHRAGELYGDFWFNSEPLPVSALRGQVILIHFWDFSCTHSQRSLPYIREWWKKYRDYGLVVVGVHTPKFPFGRDPGAVQRAIDRLKIGYPVVMDNEGSIANRYGSMVWPSLFLIDRAGYIRMQTAGEGEYGTVEHAVQSLLYDAGVDVDLPLPMDVVREEDRPGAICFRATPELFTGYSRGTIGNVEGYFPESVVDYQDPGIYLEGRLYAVGSWRSGRESVIFTGESGSSGHLVLSYQGSEVSAVARAEGNQKCEIDIYQDDVPLPAAIKGTDVRLASGRSFIRIDEARSYNLLKNKEFGGHVLRLTTRSAGCSVYSLTFVSSVIPELIGTN
jgi:thiol-disulfide isomerase/thioredoxin